MPPIRNIRTIGVIAVVVIFLLSVLPFLSTTPPTNLIILPCHSVYKDELLPEGKIDPKAGIDSKSWILAPFQVEADNHLSFIDQVERCKTLIDKRSEHAILMLSGGYAKHQLELSEARSYLNLGLQRGWFSESMINKSVYLEEFSRDSYENVLFSLAKFYKLFKKYPEVITIVGFEYEEPRFVDLHLKTLGYTGENAEYIGIGPDFPERSQYESVNDYNIRKDEFFKDLEESEKKYVYDLYIENPFGSIGSKLHQKKISRDPWKKSDKISTLKSNSDPLNYLISLGDMELENAISTYDNFVLPYLPLS